MDAFWHPDSVGAMSTKLRRILVVFSLFIAFLQPSEAFAYGRENAAHAWGMVYATTASNTPFSSGASPKYVLEKKSTIFVKYIDFPDWAKNEFQLAVDVWSDNFQSTVPINIEASWAPINKAGVLGQARPESLRSEFTGAPDSTLSYPIALANAISGRDLNQSRAEIIIDVNSNISWYRSDSGRPISRTEFDLESVFLHEIAHGLGFLSSDHLEDNPAKPNYGKVTLDDPTPFDAFAISFEGKRLADYESGSPELQAAVTSKLEWVGELGVKANGGIRPLLYAPSTYEEGSSVSHLDETTFANTGVNSMMTPGIAPAEIYHQPGPLVLAMMEDMRGKPTAGLAKVIPQSVKSPKALISDSAALIYFGLPENNRAAQVTEYRIKNLKTGATKKFNSSPANFTGLKNGTPYTFSITAVNEVGQSEPKTTAPITPSASWKKTILDGTADAKYLATSSFNGNPALLYTNTKSGELILSLWSGKKWVKSIVDGDGGDAGQTTNPISGVLAMCSNTVNKKQSLHIFYSEPVGQDLRYATYDGKKFTYEIVDGNAQVANDYRDLNRTRTNGKLSYSFACAADTRGVQVFYRDDTQGILLGAVKENDSADWVYELVDGDRKTDGRSDGNLGFRVDAYSDGKKTWVLYDSMRPEQNSRDANFGEIRLATRTSITANTWSYKTLDSTLTAPFVPGYDVDLTPSNQGVTATWLITPVANVPNPLQIRWVNLEKSASAKTISVSNFGTPDRYITGDGKTTIFNCQERLCALDTASSKVSLVSKDQNPDGVKSAWVLINKTRYLVAGIKGQLTLLRP
jgi:hypothetical protein